MLKTKELLADCAEYGQIVRAWEGVREIQTMPGAPSHPGPLSLTDARKFVSSVYALVRTARPSTIYRFYETANLQAPYGKEHKSFVSGAVKTRVPAGRLGGWWSPKRPSSSIDNLGLSSDHRKDDRRAIAVLKEWNRFDVCLQAGLQPGSLVYAGRTAPQAENVAFESEQGRTILYGGGAMQLLLVRGSSHVVPQQEYAVR